MGVVMFQYMLSTVRRLSLNPDIRLAGLLRAEHRLRAMLSDGTVSRGEVRRMGLPLAVARQTVIRWRIDPSPDGYGVILDGRLLTFTPFTVTIRGVGSFDIRSGGPLPDGMLCGRAFLYVSGEDDLPHMTLFPDADA